MLSFALLASPGCLVRHRKIAKARPKAPVLTAGIDELIEQLRQRYQSIETLNATVDLEPSLLSVSKGEIAEYKDVRGYILFRKPEWIRVVALYPVVRGTAFDMVSDGRSFRLYLPSKNLFLEGPNRIEKPSPKKIENLRPEHLLEALLIRAPQSSERAAIENSDDQGTPSYIMHIIKQDSPNRVHLTRNVWFDRATLQVTRQRVFDHQGDVVSDARYAEWQRFGNVVYPKHIVITRPKEEYELNVVFQKLAFNEAIGQEKFSLPEPPGVKVQRLGEGQERPAGTGDQARSRGGAGGHRGQ